MANETNLFEVRDNELFVSGISVGNLDQPHVQEILLRTNEEALASVVTTDYHACPSCGGRFQLSHESADDLLHFGYCERCLASLVWHVDADRVYNLQGASGFRSIDNPLLGVVSRHARVMVKRRLEAAARKGGEA